MAQTRIRLITAAASALLLGGMVVYAYADARGDRFAIGFLALAAIAAAGYGLSARFEPFIGLALAAAAGAYLIHLHADHDHLPLSTALYAGGLLGVAELAHRSVVEGTVAVPVVSFRRWSLRVLGLAATVSVGTAAVVEILRAVHGRSPWLEPLGFIAILGAILVFRGERRSRPG